jgi:hypothetical protein
MFQVGVNDINHVHSILFYFTTFVIGNHGKEGIVMPREVFENDSKDFISDIKVSVDVTLATDDDKRLKAHNKEFTN